MKRLNSKRLRRGGDPVRDGRHLEARHPVPSAAWQKRFSELSRTIGGITQRMLTLQLRELEEAGIVLRTVHAEVPPRVDYELTELGHSLQPVLIAMRNWGVQYARRHDAAGGRHDDACAAAMPSDAADSKQK